MTLTRDMKLIGVRECMKKMVSKGWFDICSVDACCELLEVSMPRESKCFMRMFHCVQYADIPKDALEVIKHILEETFAQDVFEIEVGVANVVQAKVIDEQKPKRTILRLLGGG